MAGRASTPPVLDDDTAAAFRRDGAVKLEGLASPRWVEALRAAAEKTSRILVHYVTSTRKRPARAVASTTTSSCGRGTTRFGNGSATPAWKRSTVAMGSETAHIFYDQLFVKEWGHSPA